VTTKAIKHDSSKLRTDLLPVEALHLPNATCKAIADAMLTRNISDIESASSILSDNVLLSDIARVMTFGANKYGDNNWRAGRGLGITRVLAAALRHAISYAEGEENDPESGLPHLAHAACCVAFAEWYALHVEDGYDQS
jgi:hypothetical protein